MKYSNNSGIQDENDGENFAGTCQGAASALNSSLFHTIVLDSGNNVYIINRTLENLIISRRKATDNDKVSARNITLQPLEVVNDKIKLQYKEKNKMLTLIDVLFVPYFMANLVSLQRLNKIGLHYDTSDPGILFNLKNGRRVTVAEIAQSKTGHLILGDFTPLQPVAVVVSSTKARKVTYKSAAQWHHIIAHPGVRAIEALPFNTEGVDLGDSIAISTIDCETCLLSKAKAVILRRSEKHREANVQAESRLMAVASCDLIEMEESVDGNKFLSHFYYDAKTFHVAYPVKPKKKAVAAFKSHFTWMKSIHGAKNNFSSDRWRKSD